MFFLQDYANLVFFLGLYLAVLVFWLKWFVTKNSCIIIESTFKHFEFQLKTIDLSSFLFSVASGGIFVIFAILYLAVHPDFASLNCQYHVKNGHNAPHYQCEYLEQNYSGLSTKISFSRLNKVELRPKSEDTYFPLHFILTISRIKGDSYPQSKMKQLQRFITNFYRITNLELDAPTEAIYFPTRIERQDYRQWSNNKNRIETFITEYSDRTLYIEQDATAILERKLGKKIDKDNKYFFQLGLEIIVFIAFFSFLVLAIAPTIKCTADLDKNNFKILRQRFFGRTTFEQNLKLDEIKTMLYVGEEDMIGGRMILQLKDRSIVPITYVLTNKNSWTKVKVCKIFNRLITSDFNTD